MTVKDNSLYEQTIDVTSDYLGPAARRFIDRQVKSHLNKPPGTLADEDLESLIDWLRAAVSILTDDNSLVLEYTTRLKNLTKQD